MGYHTGERIRGAEQGRLDVTANENRTNLCGSSNEGEKRVADLIKATTFEMSLAECDIGTNSSLRGTF